MTCPQTRLLLHAYIDNELDIPHVLELEQHVETCHSCSEQLDSAKALQASLRNLRSAEDPAPVYLESKVRAHLREANRTPGRTAWFRWAPAAAGLAAMVIAGVFFTQTLARRGDTGIAHDIVSSHVRSLIGTHLMDIPSSEQHTVKPWFAGKIDYSPPVRDFAAQGFPLAGGRVDYLASRPVAVMIYKRRQHVINHYVWPDDTAPNEVSSLSEKGFNLEHWRQGGMNHWLVSDLNQAELKQFADMLSHDPSSSKP